ncbi:MAG: CHASE domain-containing protein [Marinomonas sp.]
MTQSNLKTDKSGSVRDRLASLLLALPRVSAISVFVFMMIVTVIGTVAIERNERAKHERLMREVSHAVAADLDRRVSSHAAFLSAGAALFSVVDEVDKAVFASFVNALPRADDPAGSLGVGWAQAVQATQASSLKVPVIFLQPESEGNRRSIGFDLYSEAIRHKAIDIAIRTGQPIASGKLQPANRKKGKGLGFLILMPVFDGSANRTAGNNNAERALKGFVFTPFNASLALEEAVASSAHKDLNVRLYDGDALPENLLAFHKGDNVGGTSTLETVLVANHKLTISVDSAFRERISPLALETLLLGFAIALLLALLIHFLTQRAAENKAAVERLQQQSSIRASLTRELNHRAKNTLANVLSIISLTRRRSTDLDQFADALDGRVRALSATHDLLTRSEWSTTPLRAILETELSSLIEAREGAVRLTGPDTLLAPNDALSLGLAVHELATNAARFGSLSVPEGELWVSWRLAGQDVAIVEWRELGGPPVPQERTQGFGTDLIEKVVAHELRNPVDLQFLPEGVLCTFHVPVRERADFAIRQKPSISRL